MGLFFGLEIQIQVWCITNCFFGNTCVPIWAIRLCGNCSKETWRPWGPGNEDGFWTQDRGFGISEFCQFSFSKNIKQILTVYLRTLSPSTVCTYLSTLKFEFFTCILFGNKLFEILIQPKKFWFYQIFKSDSKMEIIVVFGPNFLPAFNGQNRNGIFVHAAESDFFTAGGVLLPWHSNCTNCFRPLEVCKYTLWAIIMEKVMKRRRKCTM